MENHSKDQLQKALENLNLILEMWIPVLHEIKNMNRQLDTLPANVSLLQEKISLLNQASLHAPKNAIAPERSQQIQRIQAIEPKLQILMNSLGTEITQLHDLEQKIGNLIALRERIEALQEQYQTNSTPSFKKV
jgi:DNA repair exonuclease SbcCD ATPase subunit